MHIFREGEPKAVHAPAYIQHTPTQLSKKQAVARCRLQTGARIRANQVHDIPYEERICQRSTMDGERAARVTALHTPRLDDR